MIPFYEDFMVKLVWILGGAFMKKKHGKSNSQFISVLILPSLSILFPYYLHNFYILWRRNIFLVNAFRYLALCSYDK